MGNNKKLFNNKINKKLEYVSNDKNKLLKIYYWSYKKTINC